MKKIYTLALLVLPFLAFSQWEQLGQTMPLTSKVSTTALNEKGNIRAFSTKIIENDTVTRSMVIVSKYNKFLKTWNQVGDSLEVYKRIGPDYFDNKAVSRVSLVLNSKGDKMTVCTEKRFYKSNALTVQLYKFNGSKWIPLGNKITRDFTYMSPIFTEFTTEYLTLHHYFLYDNMSKKIEVFNFKNDTWQQIGGTLITEEEKGRCALSKTKPVKLALSRPTKNKVDIYEYKNSNWTITSTIPISMGSDIFNVKLNEKGNKIFLYNGYKISSLLAYEYNSNSNNWSLIDNEIKFLENENLHGLNINDYGDLIAVYSRKPINDSSFIPKLSLYKYDNNVWNKSEANISLNHGISNLAMNKRGNTIAFIDEKELYSPKSLKVYTDTSVKAEDFGKKFRIYPNPSTTGETKVTLGDTYEDITVTVTDFRGKEYFKSTYNNVSEFKLQTDYPFGIYFVTITSYDNKKTLLLLVY